MAKEELRSAIENTNTYIKGLIVGNPNRSTFSKKSFPPCPAMPKHVLYGHGQNSSK